MTSLKVTGGVIPPPSLYCFKGGWDAEQELYPLKAGELLILTPRFLSRQR